MFKMLSFVLNSKDDSRNNTGKYDYAKHDYECFHVIYENASLDYGSVKLMLQQ